MSDARIAKLRNNAASLRMKVVTGEVAVAAARDLSVRLPKILLAEIGQEVASGKLAERWAEALKAADEALGPEEAQVGALASLLTEFAKGVQVKAKAYVKELEDARAQAAGRAQGIEEALALLEEPDPTPEEEPQASTSAT